MEEKILDLLNALQNAIVKMAPEAWSIMIKQQITKGAVSVFIGIIVIIFITIGGNHIIDFGNKYYADEEEKASNKLIIRILQLVLVFIVLLCIKDDIIRIINPAYYAMLDIVEWIK